MSGFGRCLCGAVRFELSCDELRPTVARHCCYCRRAHGAPSENVSLVRWEDLDVKSRAPWYEIRDGQPQLDALPRGSEPESLG